MALPTMSELTIVSVTALVQNRQPLNTPVFCPCPGGEIGRRRGFKIPRWKHCAGSSPAPGTIFITLKQMVTDTPLTKGTHLLTLIDIWGSLGDPQG